jgi:hypothetical protein
VAGIRIELQRSGGFGGLSLRHALDTADLGADAQRDIAALVEAAAQAPRPAATPPAVRDAMRYDLTISQGGRVQLLSFSDVTMPPEVRPLVQRVIAEGRSA